MNRNQKADSSSTPIWAERTHKLLTEKGINQQELAKRCDTAPSTISEWIGGSSHREPKIRGIKSVADALGVSIDYLLGADECKTPTNEQIHQITGLSDKALDELIKLQHSVEAKEKGAAEKLAVCNYLLETLNSTKLFDYLYNYLLGELCFKKGNEELVAATVYLKSADGEIAERLAFAEAYSHVYHAMVVDELSLLKDAADKAKEPKQKADYETWKKTDTAKKIELETLKMQADYEDGEELP